MVQNTNKNSLKLLSFFVKLYPYRFALALCALLLSGLMETIGIGALLPLLDLVLNTNSEGEHNMLVQPINALFDTIGLEKNFTNLLLLIVIMITLKALVIFQAMKTVSYIAVDITNDLSQKLINALILAKWKFYSSLDVGQSANAIATEADKAGQFCVIMGKTIISLFQVFIYALIAFTVDWRISLAALVLGAIAAFILKFLVRMARDSGNDMAEVLNKLVSRLTEALSGAKPLKAMGEEKRFVALLTKDTIDLQTARKKFALSSHLLNLFHEPLMVILLALGLGWAHGYAGISLSSLFMLAFLFNRLFGQVNLVQNHYQKSAVFEGAVNRILQKIERAALEKEQHFGSTIPKLEQAIRFDDLSLSYGKDVVISSFSDQMPAGQLSVIFGPSGSGKSSILDATLGMLSYKEGDIFIDGTSLSQVNISRWRGMIGYVPQETFLFNDTIAKNISLGDQTISEEKMVEALKAADAWGFVGKLEDGLYHIVGERGGKLSGGQRQRIALARALVRQPKLLILDEATSGLDKGSEAVIFDHLKTLMPDITIIIISHDPKILDIADHVIRLDKIV